MLTRYDTAPINRITQDAQTGFVHITNVPIACVGVFPYMKADNSVEMEAKLPTELLSEGTVSSANSKPITDNHPDELVTQVNARNYMKGFTATNAHVENDKLKVDMTITDKSLIDEINKGKQELSIGFETEVVPKKGEYKGVAYDSVQRNIRINHVAVVEQGRAGHSVRLLGDSAEMIEQDVQKKGKRMDTTKVRLDGADVTVATADADKIIKLDADNADKAKKIAELEAQIEEKKKELDELKGKSEEEKKNADEAQAKADAAEKELDSLKKEYSGDAMQKAVNDRLNLVGKVKPYLGDSYDFNGKTDKQLKLDTITALDSSIDLKDKSDDYINAYFDAALQAKNAPRVNGYGGSEVKSDKSAVEELRDRRYNFA